MTSIESPEIFSFVLLNAFVRSETVLNDIQNEYLILYLLFLYYWSRNLKSLSTLWIFFNWKLINRWYRWHPHLHFFFYNNLYYGVELRSLLKAKIASSTLSWVTSLKSNENVSIKILLHTFASKKENRTKQFFF